MTPNSTLISTDEEFQRELETALGEAKSFSICTPAIDSGWGRWPIWKVLTKNLDKLDRAYVALDGMRSEPYALDVLYRSNALRCVPSIDGSYRANLWRICRGRSVIVFMGAGDLCEPGTAAPINAMIRWTGKRDDPFALKIERLIESVSAVASVPTRNELSQYRQCRNKCIHHWDKFHRKGPLYIWPIVPDPTLPRLTLIEGKGPIKAGQHEIWRAFSQAGQVLRQRIRFPRGNFEREIFWIPSLALWGAFGVWKENDRYWNGFGTDAPNSLRSLSPAFEINLPLSGIDRRVKGALGRDNATGTFYLLYRGRTGARDSDGNDLIHRRYRGCTYLKESDREESTLVAVVGKLGAPDFLGDLAAFVHSIGHIKKSIR